jgi:broad specificity phosphatase PhoE
MSKKENNEKILKSIIIMRHGERIDCIDSQKNNQLLSEYDPELTEKGIKQAKDIGNQIKKSIKKEINTLNIYTSPFTRTIMTGLNLAQKLKLKNNNIFIFNSLFEIASVNNFKYFPLNTLLIKNKKQKNNFSINIHQH